MPRRLRFLLLCALLIVIAMGLRWCQRSPQSPSPTPAPAAPTSPPATAFPPAAPSASDTDVPQPGPTASPPPATGMISLTFRFEKGMAVEAARETIGNTEVRPLRRIEGQTGIYHRVVGPQGEVLYENLVPDPRRVPWDTTDDGKHLKGGVATLNEMPLILRLPAAVHGKLEIYEVTDSQWTRSTLDKTARLVGQSSL